MVAVIHCGRLCGALRDMISGSWVAESIDNVAHFKYYRGGEKEGGGLRYAEKNNFYEYPCK